jgi:hypothetical protein
MKELKKQHLEMLQLLESIEVMFQNGDSIHPNSVIRGAIQTAIGMEVDVTNVNNKCDNKQTAVEKMIQYFIEQKNNGASHWCIDDLIAQLHQAKAMEKEQHKQIWQDSRKIKSECSNWNCTGDEKLHEFFEQYYNETFKSE